MVSALDVNDGGHLLLGRAGGAAAVPVPGLITGLVRRLLGRRLGVLDGDPGAFWLDHGDRDADLEDSLAVLGGDVGGVDRGGEPDRAGERSVAELRVIRPVVLLAALGADGQDPAERR